MNAFHEHPVQCRNNESALEWLKRNRMFRGSYYKKRNSQYLEKDNEL